jgi:hypothetical protein
LVISASEAIYLWERRSLPHTLRNALEAATALHEQGDDAVRMALLVAERAANPRHKATLLSGVARILTEAGRTGDGLEILLKALVVSELAGRDAVLEVLADGAMTLASVDNGELLWKICQELESIDEWFTQ